MQALRPHCSCPVCAANALIQLFLSSGVAADMMSCSCGFSSAKHSSRFPCDDSSRTRVPGLMTKVPAGFEDCSTEEWDDSGALTRRSVLLLPESGCNTENLAAIVTRCTLPSAVSGITTLSPREALDVVDARVGTRRC